MLLLVFVVRIQKSDWAKTSSQVLLFIEVKTEFSTTHTMARDSGRDSSIFRMKLPSSCDFQELNT